MESNVVGDFRISADHPALPGHFPGQPVVPGAVLLDEAMRLMEKKGYPRATAFTMIKFRQPVKPDTTCFVIAEKRHGKLTITITCNEVTVMTAVVKFQ